MWMVQAGYSLGNSQFKAMYGATTFDSDNWVKNPELSPILSTRNDDTLTGDRNVWAVGYDYNFSKRTKVYALYTDVTDDRADWVAGSEWSGFSLGLMHSF
jgi:predicted porin